MNPNLTKVQETELCALVGNVKLRLLFKATNNGYTAASFHQQCDGKNPTIAVGYNSSGYVFGGYTSVAYNQTGQYVADDKAFLFTFNGGKPMKYPVTNSPYAVRMLGNYGPYFGEDLKFYPNNYGYTVQSSPGNYYTYNAAQMHGNDLQLTEFEVYQVEEDGDPKMLEKPWRNILWKAERKKELIDSIKLYKPMISSVSPVKVLLIGPVGAGKSSFFNSVNSVFRGHVTNQAISGTSGTSLTTQFRTYPVKAERDGKPLPIIFCDTMGLEEEVGSGLDVEDITSILKGHIPNRYQFNPSVPLQAEAQAYCKSVGLKEQIHCVVYIIDTCKVSLMSAKLEGKFTAIRRKVNFLGIPQLVLMTKVDEACACVAEDLQNIYKSQYIRSKAQEVSSRIGVPMTCVVPVKNYSEELELEPNCDILLLSAVVQMLRLVDDYLEDVSQKES
ncbi:interferon-induced protein 44-like [Aplochiton taeniatus]